MSYVMNSTVAYNVTHEELERTLALWDARDWTIDCLAHPRRYDAVRNLINGRDADWTADTRRVTVSFVSPKGTRVTVSEDRHRRPADNLRVLFLCLDGMRKNEMRGFGEVMASAYLQLNAPAARTPWTVLGITPNTPRDIIDAAYRAAAKRRHPDVPGGSHEAMAELNAAYEYIKGTES